MIRLLFHGHAGNHNRGCEAIVRSTLAILGRHLDDFNIIVASNDSELDHALDLGPSLNWVRSRRHERVAHSLVRRYVFAFERRASHWYPLQFAEYRPTLDAAQGVDAAFSIGGDNYSENSAAFLSALDERIRRQCSHTVLWGCSLDPGLLAASQAKLTNLKAFDLITARESITYQGLLDHGIVDGVYLHTDPAFAMEPEPVELPVNFVPGGTIGLNISPLIERFEANRGETLHSAVALVDHILSQTDMSVVLVPHVVYGSDDRIPLSKLYAHFCDSGRICMLDGTLNSPQTKYIISQCRLFIGARTHSTIAAYSTCVPTLALGYSVKARGIARDIFGSELGLVLPVQELTSEKQLINAFEGLREREDDLRTHLNVFMPTYIQNAWDAGVRVAELLKV